MSSVLTAGPQRFWDKVQKGVSCWLWIAAKNHQGYGKFWFNGQIVSAHRFAYEQVKGSIPKDLECDHLCRNPSCVNPCHLEPVTHTENYLRGVTNVCIKNAKKTHCIHGHELKGDNLVRSKLKKGWRQCRICQNLCNRTWIKNKRRSSVK